MKRILYIISSLLVLASCVKSQVDIDGGKPSFDLSVTFDTKAGGSGSGSNVAAPVINCMRVLIFNGETEGSNVVFNSFYAFGFNTDRTEPVIGETPTPGKYTISLANPIVLDQTTCRNFNVYVVLNEEGFSLSGATSEDLHTKLGDFDGTETQLQTILHTPAVYAEVLKNVDEPAFLISGMTSVTFGPGQLGSAQPVNIPASKNGYNRGRSMAEIIINKITSEPAPGQDDYSSQNVPLIFVKSVTLENIPNTIAWSDENGNLTTGMMTAQEVGSAKTHEDGSGTYYDRDWYGHITRTITNLWAQKVQYTDAKFYRTAEATDANKNEWRFNVKPFRQYLNPSPDPDPIDPVKPGAAPYEYTAAQGNNATPAVADNINAIKALERWDKGDDKNKSNGILANQLLEVFEALQDGSPDMSENITYTSFEVTGVQEKTEAGKTKTSIGSITPTTDYWTVRLGDKFYVPENVQSSSTNATCLKVTLAIAQPKFSFRLVTPNDKGETNKSVGVLTEDLNSLNDEQKKNYTPVKFSDLPSPSSLNETGITYSYYMDYEEIKTKNEVTTRTDQSKQIKEIDGDIVKSYGKVAWSDDASHILELQNETWYDGGGKRKIPDNFYDDHGHYYVYLDGFNRKSQEIQTTDTKGAIVVNETLEGSSFSWNVPDGPDTSTSNDIHVFTFKIPINNNIGGATTADYSVRRNTRYTVTLYVNETTYGSLSTKSGESLPFTITAKVTTEKVSDYEE